jgi:hypothetical protein
MKYLLTLLIILQLISCSEIDQETTNNWLCSNQLRLLETSTTTDTVIIDLSKSSSNQLRDLRNQLTWNPCNKTNLLNGKIIFTDSTKLLIAYRARPYCKDDTNINPPYCFPDPTIDIYFISDTLIAIENKVINLNQLSKDEKYFSFKNWGMFKKKIFEFNSLKLIDTKIKERILKGLLDRHFSILDSICFNHNGKSLCQQDTLVVDSLKKIYPVYFAQTDLPPLVDEIDTLDNDFELEPDLTPKE